MRPSAPAIAARVAAGTGLVLLATAVAPGLLPIGVVVQGAVFGATTGLLAVGLVLTYQATRIVNFAHGALGALGGAVGVSLYLGRQWPWFVAVLVGVAVAAVAGAAVDALVVRRFESASRLTLTVATIGVAQILGGVSLLVPKWFDAPQLIGAFDTGLSDTTARLRPVLFTGNELVMAVVVPVAIAALGWFLYRTDAGVAVRAAAENRDRARLLAVPVRRLSSLVWATSSGLAALTLLLIAPSQGLSSNLGITPLALLPALAAAVVAGMSSLWVAFGAAVGLGVLDQLVRWHVDAKSVTTVVFLTVIVVALLLRRSTLGREEPGDNTLGGSSPPPASADERARKTPRALKLAGLVAAAGILLLAPAVLGPSDVFLFSIGVVYAMVGVSLVALTGWGGQVSLGQFAFVGVGGVVSANLVLRFNLDVFWAFAASGLAGALVAVLIGLPALRIRGAFLAVSTLAFAVAVDAYAFNPTNFASWLPFSVDRPVLMHRIDLGSETAFAYFSLALLAVTVLLVSGLRRGRPGRSVLAVRDNPRAAAALAVPVTRTRLSAFVVAGGVAGVAGALHVHLLGGISTGTYAPATSLVVFSMAIIGGIESLPGVVAGVVLVQVVGRFYPDYQVILTGAGMLLLLVLVPGGLAEVGRRVRRRALWALSPSRPPVSSATDIEVVPDRVPERDVAVTETDVGDTPMPLLRCRGVEAAYGSLQVLFGIDLEVEEGEVVALLGTNGAGKSTVLRVLTGLLPSTAGGVWVDGRPLDGASPESIARSGIAMVPGGRGVFPGLTVAENLQVASWMFRKDPSTVAARRAEMVEMFPILAERLDQAAGSLSGGEQQMVALAQAFIGKPRLLLIDELSLGLSPAVVSELLEAVRRRVDDGVTVVLVEQSVNIALTVAQRAIFLEKGEVRFSGPTVDLLDRPDVLHAVFLPGATGGASLEASPVRATTPEHTGPVLACRGLRKHFGGIVAVDDVDLDVQPGQILGLIGHNGAGKTTLFDLVSGFTVADRGTVELDGVDISSRTPSDRARAGLARSFQEARLFPSLDVTETLSLALDRHLRGRGDGFVATAMRLPAATDAERLVAERVAALIDQLGLGHYARTPTGHLSTGTRRIVELGCVLAASPQVLLLDEPSAGVAQRETEHLGPLLRQVQEDTGCSIVIIEHDMPLLTGLCDELVALDRGAVITRGRPKEVLDHPLVVSSYLGGDPDAIARSGARPTPGPRRRGRLVSSRSTP